MKNLYPISQTAAAPSPASLTDADMSAYQRTGFLAVENVLSPDEIAAASRALDALLHEQIRDVALMPEPDQREQFDSLPPGNRAHLVRKLMHFVAASPPLRAISEHAGVLDIVGRLVGEEVRMIQDMALVKPAHIGSEKPWHQDLAYFDWHPADGVIGVWIALDAATVENGCMCVLPGSHAAGPVAHVHLRDCQIPDERVTAENSVAVPLQPGGALFFHSLLHHGTPPNASVFGRRALQFHYAGLSCLQRSLRAHATDFFEGDTYRGCRAPHTVTLAELTGPL
jgi:phytanoyl-CoA hydroxylase